MPRVSCFKGLYREGRMSDDIDFTQWQEIDCDTGVEIKGSLGGRSAQNVINIFGEI